MATKKSSPAKTTKPVKKAVKKTAPKNEEPTDIMQQEVQTFPPYRPSTSASELIKKRKPLLIGILTVIIIITLLFYFRSIFIVATVNGQPITRLSLIQELEKQSGKNVIESLVTRTLILQEAQKQNVIISQEEISKEIKKIEESVAKQGQKIDDLLAQQGMKKSDLEEQIKIQKMIETMIKKDIKVSDKEVSDYIDQNKESLGQEASSKDLENKIRESLTQQKLSERFQSWIEELRTKSKINYFVQF